MKPRLIVASMSAFLVLCGLAALARACPPPQCEECYEWNENQNQCVPICGCWPSGIGFTVWPSTNNRYVCIHDTVTFSAWPYTWDGDGCFLTYSWDFGRDAYDTSEGDSNWESCRYSSPGDRTVTLTVTRVTIPSPCCSTPRTDSFSRTVTAVELASVTSDKDSPAICEDVTFTVTTNPPGHEDLDTVQWSGGGYPESQQGGTTFTTHWPCVGDKTVTASYCNSSKSKGVTVSLPGGCSPCSGVPTVSLNANMIEHTDKDECDWFCKCGTAGPAENIVVNVVTPCYDDCNWRFGVTATADYLFGPCTDNERYDNYFNISGGDDPLLNEENYCEIVADFDYDPAIEETGLGCVDVDGLVYSNTDGLWIHEGRHAQDFRDNLVDEEAALATDPALSPMAIDCSDPATLTCEAAKSTRQEAIESAVNEAYLNASADLPEESAREAAWETFHNLALEICDHALTEGWTPCDHCH
jgi:hypothetical protein